MCFQFFLESTKREREEPMVRAGVVMKGTVLFLGSSPSPPLAVPLRGKAMNQTLLPPSQPTSVGRV